MTFKTLKDRNLELSEATLTKWKDQSIPHKMYQEYILLRSFSELTFLV
jgi:hypothetical protein